MTPSAGKTDSGNSWRRFAAVPSLATHQRRRPQPCQPVAVGAVVPASGAEGPATGCAGTMPARRTAAATASKVHGGTGGSTIGPEVPQPDAAAITAAAQLQVAALLQAAAMSSHECNARWPGGWNWQLRRWWRAGVLSTHSYTNQAVSRASFLGMAAFGVSGCNQRGSRMGNRVL